MDVYGGNFQPGQWENILRNPHGLASAQYAGGILSGPMQSMGSHGVLQQSNSDADRWQRATYFQKGLFTSPTTPAPVMHKAERKYPVGKVTDEEEAKQRQLKAILDKLTPRNFGKLFEQVKAVNIDNSGTLTGFISQIFDKALMEPTFCDMYVDFCCHLARELPDFGEDNEKITFKRLLLNKCQKEFERVEREREEVDRADPEGEINQSREEKRIQARRRMLGNIRFIGELYKKKMLTERIMHSCIKKLLGEYQNPEEVDIEALCELMSTIGEMIDHPKAKEHMDAYFDRMSELSNNMKLCSRVRFMLKDAIDLRTNKWQLKKMFDGVVGDEDRWNKIPGPLNSSRYLRMDVYGGNFQPGQWENVLRNPHGLAPAQYAGGILSGPMQSVGSQGVVQQINSDADRWQCATYFQKGLLTSPATPAPVMHKPKRKYQVGKVTDEEEAKQRQLKAILNKLTPQNFEKLFGQVNAVNIDNAGTLTGFISQIFDKALMEPTFCDMYADLCYRLAKELPVFSEENEIITFKRLLLNKCQEEFERGERERQEADRADLEGEVKQYPEESEEKRIQARRRMLGNIRFIGELYKKKMLTERIMHECIQKLLGEYQNPDEEDIEALCELMSTIGETIDHPKAKEHMDAYFDRMSELSNNMKLCSRVRFMLKDAIDLRKNIWQLKKMFDGENDLILPFANLTFVKYL